jgi:hypothetical protein
MRSQRDTKQIVVYTCVLLCGLAASAASAQQTSSQPASRQTESVPASCVLTPRPMREFVPPVDYRPERLPEGFFFIGSERLWTVIREPMVWQWRPHGPGHELDLTEKVFWYRVGYSWRKEPVPKLRVTGRRLDGPLPPLRLRRARQLMSSWTLREEPC